MNEWEKIEKLQGSQNLILKHLETKDVEAIKNRKIHIDTAFDIMPVNRSSIIKVSNTPMIKVDWYDFMHSPTMQTYFEVEDEIIRTLKNSEHDIRLETLVDIVYSLLGVNKKHIKSRIASMKHEGIIEESLMEPSRVKDGEGPSKEVETVWKYLRLDESYKLEQ